MAYDVFASAAMGRIRPFVFLLCLVAGPVFADALRLTSGQVIEGKIIDESEAAVVVRTRMGLVSIEKKDILDIERDGGQKRIARVPRETPGPLNAAALSFIPFYCGLYQSPDAAAGLPFAAANGYYALLLLRQLTTATAFTDWGNRHRSTDNLVVYQLQLEAIRQGDPSFNPDQAYGILNTYVRGSFLAPAVFRLTPTQSVRYAGDIYTKDEFTDYRRRTFYRYAGASLLGAAASFAYFRWLLPYRLSAAGGSGAQVAGLLLQGDGQGGRVALQITF